MKKNFVVPNPERIEYVIGIDFGHGETSAAITRIDSEQDPEDIDLTGTGQKTIPSVMHVGSENKITLGDGAVHQYTKEGGNFYAYFKQSPNTLNEQEIPNLNVMKLFMKTVYETICYRRSGELMEGSTIKQNHVVFIACPSKSQKWDDQAMQNYVQLALDAGLPIAGVSIDDKFTLSGIVRESRAAYIRMLQKNEVAQKSKEGILVVDYGSSTIDITYYKEDEHPVDKGYSLGASIVEESILNYLHEYHKELDGDQAPDFLKSLKEQNFPLYTGVLYKMRQQKEDFYSDFEYADFIEFKYRFPAIYGKIKLDVEISKATLTQKILKDYIENVKCAFVDFKENIIKDKPITLLVLTGGASRMNFVHDLAKSVFGDVKMLPPQDPSLTVSNGIATAGRADIKLFYMANELLNKKIPDKVYQDVKNDTIENILNLVIAEVHRVYNNFKQGLSSPLKNNIADLEVLVKQNVNSLKSRYRLELDSAFRKNLQKYINNEIQLDIQEYKDKYFPTYKISAPTKYNAPQNISISFTPENLNTINATIDDSVSKITEGFVGFLAILAWNIIFGTIAFVLALIRNGGAAIVNLFRDKGKEVKYVDVEDWVNNVTLNTNDKGTILTDNQRKEIYDTFIAKKGEYKSSLKQDITNKMPSFKAECNATAKEIISQYIIDEINRIQLQIK